MRDIGALEIALIVGAIVLVFGVGKLGQIGGALGKSIHDFRKEKDRKDDLPEATTGEAGSGKPVAQLEVNAGSGKHCPSCGSRMSENARFCMECGAGLGNLASRPS